MEMQSAGPRPARPTYTGAMLSPHRAIPPALHHPLRPGWAAACGLRRAWPLAAALALGGLTGCDTASPPASQTPTAGAAGTASSGPGQRLHLFSACTTKGNREDAKGSLGPFMVSTNAWNPQAAAAFSECVKAKYDPASGTVDAQISWEVLESNNQVLSYPNFGYGWQVGTDQGSTSSRLPAQISQLGDLRASGRIETSCAPGANCTMNTAFELLFSNTPTPTVWPPTAELMVWVQASCGSCNAGTLQDKVQIDGVDFDVYKGMVTPPTGTASWTYVAYVAQKTVTQFNFNFKNFVDDSVKRGYLKTSDHLAVIELGTEITSGQGTTQISGYAIR